MITKETNSLLTDAEAAAYIGVSPGTLTVWRCTGRYNLPYIKVGRLVRYRQSDIDAWLAKRTKLLNA
jgi:excisionase family DNA binding protein